jgi:hypothetical protein
MKKLLLLMLGLLAATPAAAQWTVGQQPVIWDTSGIVGTGGASTCASGEYYNATQGGCPPASAYEFTAINESTNYTPSQWQTVSGAGTCVETDVYHTTAYDTGCRPHNGEDKLRLICGFSHFGKVDPLLFPGQLTASMLHHHTFFGNESVDQNSTYQTLRNNPKSTCAGGPLASSGYWIPSLIYEIRPGVKLPIVPDGVDVYYSVDPRISPLLVRLLRGLTVIGGVNVSDYTNSARQAELTAQPPATGQVWTQNLGVGVEQNNDGFLGYKCVRIATDGFGGAGDVALTGGGSFTRSWLTPTGDNPWGAGQCEGSNYRIWSYVSAPTCWDGYNLRSDNGRNHWRRSVAFSGVEYCPRGWWHTPGLTSIHFYPAFTHAMRRKMYLSSDRMDPNPKNWKQPGTTMHFDWMMGWDDNIFQLAERECMGVTINNVTRTGGTGTLAQGRTCATSIIADNTALKTGTSPDTTWSRNPISNETTLGAAVSKLQFGKALPSSAAVGAMSMH